MAKGKSKAKATSGSSKSKKSWEEFRAVALQAMGGPGGQSVNDSLVLEEAQLEVGGKRPARGSLEGPLNDAKKLRRPSPPSPSASQSSMDTIQLDAGPSNALNAHRAGTGDIMEGLEVAQSQVHDGESDEEGESAANEALPVWEEEILNYRRRMEKPLPAPPSAQRVGELTRKYSLGGAYIHAFGIGHLLSVVNMGEDPNLRGNPRDLNSSHVDNLFTVFSVPGSLRDHESPIYLMVSRDLIAQNLRDAMSNADPRDAAAEMPLLLLQHSRASEMLQLEEQLVSQVKGGKWMSEEELNETEARLNDLRELVPLATLLNGQHRIHAIMRLGEVTREDHSRLLARVRSQSISSEDMRTEMANIAERAKMTAYRVEVFDSEMPEELFNYLVRNEDTRPQLGMGAGEKAWWTASRWDVLMRNAEKTGARSRAAAADQAYIEWCKDIGVKIDRAVSERQPSVASKGSRSSHMKGEWAGRDAVSRLFTDPCTMELVMDTRSAMTVYNDVLRRNTMVAMLQSSGALLVGRFWLSCRTFLQIFNVAKGPGLQGIKQYLDSHCLITGDGDANAVGYWKDLHSHPQNTPEYMAFYDANLQSEFDDLYDTVLQGHELMLNIDWKANETVEQVRRVFDALGKGLESKEPEWCRKVGASMRLYARLPLAGADGSSQEPQFCPTSALPARRWLKRLVNETQNFSLRGDGLVVLEFMIDRFLPVWTVGAQSVGTSVNGHNWYGRSRGLHQILMRLVQAERCGSMDVKLNTANVLLSDSGLRQALRDVDASLGRRFRDLMREHCVLRSHPFDFPFIDSIPASELETVGGKEGLLTVIREARAELKGLIRSTPHPTVEQYHERLALPCPVFFSRTPPEFWGDFDPASWVLGWNTSPAKQFRDVNAIIGWALLIPRVDGLLQELMNSEATRQLASTVHLLSSATGEKVWWMSDHLLGATVITPQQDVNRGETQAAHMHPEVQEHSNEQQFSQRESDVGHTRLRRLGAQELGDEDCEMQDNGSEDRESEGRESEGRESEELESEDASVGKNAVHTVRVTSAQERPRVTLRLPGRKSYHLAPSSTFPKDGDTLVLRDNTTASPSATRGKAQLKTAENDARDLRSREKALDVANTRDRRSAAGYASDGDTSFPVVQADDAPGTDLSSGVPAWQQVLRRSVHHLMTPPVAPTKTLDFLLGCRLFEHQADPDVIGEAIERNADNLGNVVLRINSERQKLRQSVAIAARHCVDAEYGGYFAQVGLAPMMSCYKDIFVARVARILQEELNMAEPEAINEAMAMAVSDDLYTTDIARFNNCQGNLEVDLAQTFARGHQDQLRDEEYVQVGTVGGTQEERDQILGLLQWFHPVRGIGRTEGESAVRGMEGAILQLTRKKALKNIPPSYLSIITKPEPVPDPSKSQGAGDTPFIEDVHEKWGVGEWVAPALQMTQQDQHPFLSTGRLNIPHRGLELLRPEMKEQGARALAVAKGAMNNWHAAQGLDNVVYQHWRRQPLRLAADPPNEQSIGGEVQSAGEVATDRLTTNIPVSALPAHNMIESG